ncbi:hypothetical protein Desaci_1585 [Desulfosporosinus acidiphilus SJ4]|uniref:ArnR1-like winged helix-turn-helix domain-containing protein n=1 Tax=Desulfosporosinus acidiphilus (strain DSM 22704 / JCM 16185 / SJ4) TaxID=646529 RepID=I4D465_DESAJ|nr:hypothetical protein [Desulfosporosinus acidiphilus]AFM40589.1 hypothetical protein Desaci_1585 [Desulfosporosinus acidiphilus SJ4]
MCQIPVKFRLLQVISQNDNLSNHKILDILKKEYPHDRSVNEKGVEDYLLTLTATGLIELKNAVLDQSGNLELSYSITDYGKSLMKYVS